MMHEVFPIQQPRNEQPSRWFYAVQMNLSVWFGEDGAIVGFQLGYNMVQDPHALTWFKKSGYSHNRVSEGGSRVSPILIRDGVFVKTAIADAFREESRELPRGITDFILEKLLAYPPE